MRRANLKPLVIEGIEAGGQLMPDHGRELPRFSRRHHGPAVDGEMRAQSAHFGAEIIQGDVTSVDLSGRPFKINVEDAVLPEALIVATRRIGEVVGSRRG